MRLYAGVDGGGTKTRVQVLNLDQQTGIVVTDEGTNPNSVGFDVVIIRMIRLIGQALDRLGASESDLVALCAAMAGTGNQAVQDRLQGALQARFADTRVTVTNDALAALAAGTRGGSGVVLIAGTGSIAVGQDRFLRVERAGGYGYLLGDEGSGFAIGRKGLMAALQGHEGRGEQTALWETAVSFMGSADPQEWVRQIYQTDQAVKRIASFAKHVIEACAEDAVAQRIVSQAAIDHARLIAAVFARFDEDAIAPTVVLGGGVFSAGNGMQARLREQMPNRTLVVSDFSAAAGAALLAAQSCPTMWTEPLLTSWAETVRRIEMGEPI